MFRKALDQYHAAADQFSRGDAEPVKTMFSRADDVVLANPFGPAVRGWKDVSAALDFAASRFRDGKVSRFESLAAYESAEMATVFEIETWQARVGDRRDLTTFVLRVTSTFRREDGEWKLVHRHADSIATPNVDGPLRTT